MSFLDIIKNYDEDFYKKIYTEYNPITTQDLDFLENTDWQMDYRDLNNPLDMEFDSNLFSTMTDS